MRPPQHAVRNGWPQLYRSDGPIARDVLLSDSGARWHDPVLDRWLQSRLFNRLIHASAIGPDHLLASARKTQLLPFALHPERIFH